MHESLTTEQLASRIDKMVGAGRITNGEASRVRQAAERGEDVDAALLAIRLRHVREWVASEVATGRLTETEAADVIARAARGEAPRALRSGSRTGLEPPIE